MQKTIQTLGIVGSNLLASMLCIEARKRGIQTVLLEPELRSITSEFSDQHLTAPINEASIERLELRTDAIVFCTTQIPNYQSKTQPEQPVYPTQAGRSLVSNRIEQLVMASLCQVPVPSYVHQNNKIAFQEQLLAAQPPFKVYQVYQDGYDTIGIKTEADKQVFIGVMDDSAVEWLIEEETTYEKYLSITAIISGKKCITYPIQEEDLKEESVKYIHTPAAVTQTMQNKLIKYIRKIAKETGCEGLYTFQFGVKKNRSVELVYITPGVTVGDIATNHYTDLSVYEQFLNLIEQKPLYDATLYAPNTVTVVRTIDKHVPEGPCHEYRLDQHGKNPVSLYVKAKGQED